jgi:hypothetical protein
MSDAFRLLATPGRHVAYIHGHAYAPPMDGLPAQVFIGEWTTCAEGCDLAIWEPDSGRWQSVPCPGIGINSYLFVDPYRPIVYISAPEQLLEVDRHTLTVRPVAELTRQYTADTDPQGRLWFTKSRDLIGYDPRTGQLTTFRDITPEAYYYAEGTHMTVGAGPDGRLWTSQFPKQCVAVHDPATGQSRVVWDPSMRGHELPDAGTGSPVVTERFVWLTRLLLDARTGAVLDPPFAHSGPDECLPLYRGTWCHSPNAHQVRGDQALALRGGVTIGWLDLGTGAFTAIGELPAGLRQGGYVERGQFCAVHADRQVIFAHKNHLQVGDFASGETRVVPLGFTPSFAHGMFSWTIGPDHAFYGSCVSHDLWRVTPGDEQFTNYGNIVRQMGGELFFHAWRGRRLFVASYTQSVLTRVDLERPADHWGPAAADNPRHLLNLCERCPGQHRPTAMEIAPDGALYYISRSDYCTRREGALVEVDTEREEITAITDPMVPGEQLWALACSPTRPELYLATGLRTFLVWDRRARRIVYQTRFPQREGEGQPTSAEIHTGGIRFMAAAGDLVIGNHWGRMDLFFFDARTRTMRYHQPFPAGKVWGIYRWPQRDSFLFVTSDGIYEFTPREEARQLYPQPLPGFYLRVGPDGRLYLSDLVRIYGETAPAIHRLPQP